MSPVVQVLIVGIGTYLLRVSVVALVSATGAIPQRVERSLRLVAPAVLAALVADTLLLAGDGVRDLGSWHVAAALALAVAIWTRSAIWTIAAGMICLWVLDAIF